MHILILDDNPFRHKCYANDLSVGNTVVSVYSYNDFLTALDSRVWDVIYLDHDLGDFNDGASTYIDGWGKTQFYNGCHAALRVCELPDDKRPQKVIVQSVNGSGSADIIRCLQRAGIDCERQPFSYEGRGQ